MNILKEIFYDHKNYKLQLIKLAKNDIINEYSGTVLNWSWAVIKPSIFIAIYYVGFTFGLKVGTSIGEYSYFQWLLAGLIPWFYIRDIIVAGAASIRKNRYLVTKIKFPISVIPTFSSLSQLSINIFLTVLMLMYFVVCGDGPTIYWLQIPFYTLLMFSFFTLWSLFAGIVSAVSKDFLQLVKATTIGFFWLSGIIFDVTKVDNIIFKVVLNINPITYMVNGYRNSLIHGIWFWEEPVKLAIFMVVFSIMMGLATFVYKRLKDDVPDIL